ncbi:MAG: hypothetical protein K5799_09605 [Erythrobacter sp.]|nr:hypothetical protein [Erythrobacter sp.]
MRFNSLAFAGKSLVVPALLLALAACGDAATLVEEQTPAAEAAVATPAPVASEPVTEPVSKPTIDEPVAELVQHPATTRAPAPAPRRTTPAPVATPTPTATTTPAADPHAGHDMTAMSDEKMKEMGHN